MTTLLETPSTFRSILNDWGPNLSKALHCPNSKKEYEALCEFAYVLSEKINDKPDQNLQCLLDIIYLIIDDYQKKYCPFEKSDPITVLKFLMKDHGLVQKDLKNEIGEQGIVSEVLNGKRKLNLKMAKALAARFNTSLELFL